MIKMNNNLSEEQKRNTVIAGAFWGFFFGLLAYLIADKLVIGVIIAILFGASIIAMGLYSKAIAKIILEPKEIYKKTQGLQERNLTALLKRRGVADFLEYRVYSEEDKIGFFTMRNGSRGFALRVHPGGFVGHNVEVILTNALEVVNVQGAVANFFTYASRNLENKIKEFENIHLNNNINVEHPEVLHNMIRSRARHFRKWTKESILKGVDYRLRDFINLVCFSFPPDTPQETLNAYYAQIKGSISELSPENFTGREMVSMVKEILSPEIESWDSPADYSIDMSTQMTNEGVNIRTNPLNGEILIGENWYAKTITTKNFPEEISLSEFVGLFYDRFGSSVQNTISSPFLCSLVISYDNIEETNKRLSNIASWNISELNKIDNSVKDAHPELHRRAEEARLVARYQEAGQVPLNAMWTLTIFDNNKARLEECYGKTVAQFKKKNWSLVQESFGNVALVSMLSSLPLNFNPNVKELLQRFRILFLSNNTQIAPLIADTSGSSMVIPYIGRSGQLQGFDFYDSDTNFNMVTAGESGSGKSYSQNDIHAMCLAAGYNIRGIDAGHSYKYLNNFIGGQYIAFTEGSDICLNFFTKIILQRKYLRDERGEILYDINDEPIETDELEKIKDPNGNLQNIIHTDEYKTIVPIIGQMAGVNLAATTSENSNLVNDLNTKFLATCVEQAIQEAYWQQKENAGMNTVYRALQDITKDLIKKDRKKDAELLSRFTDAISPYCVQGGMFYGYFNGPNNVNFKSSYVIAELDELKNKGDLYNVVLMSFAQTVMAEFFGDRETEKIFFVDEAWMIFDKPIVITFLNDLYRRIRKYNGIAITLTQGIQDFFKNIMTESMYNNAAWKYFLQLSSDGVEQVVSQKKVHLNELTIRLMKSIRNNKTLKLGETMIKSEKRTMISRIKTDPLSHYTYSAMNPKGEKPYIDSLMQKYDVTVQDAVKIAAFAAEHEISTDESFKMVRGDNIELLSELQKREELEKYAIIIADAINLNKIRIFRQTIESTDGLPPIYENLARLEKEDRSVESPLTFLEKAKELNLLPDIEKVIIEKTFSFYEKNNEQFSLNFMMSHLHNEELCHFLTNRVATSSASNRFLIEVVIDEDSEKMDDKLVEFLARLRNYNVRIALDNIGINVKLDKLLRINPDMIKLDGQLIKDIESDKKALFVLEMLIPLCKKLNIKTAAVHVEREGVYDLAKKLEIDYIQGYLIDKPVLVA